MHFHAALAALATLAALLGTAILPAHGQQGADLFRGKEISLLIGAGAGGGADIYARTLARHYGRLLPGSPAVVAKNVPGAGGLKLANQIYNVSPKDGTELALFPVAAALEPLFGNREAMFETTRFTWIGNMDTDSTGCSTWKHTGIKTWEDLKNRETTFGASGPASTSSMQAKAVGVLLGANTRVIHGYQGLRMSMLAMQRGELDGICGVYMSTYRSQFARELESGDLTIWVTFGKERTKEYPRVPSIYELLKNDADRQLADLIFGQDAIGRPISGPPGLSPERTQALRNGMTAAMKDRAFLEEANKLGLGIAPMTGEETQQRFEAFYNLPAAVVNRAKEVIGRKTQ